MRDGYTSKPNFDLIEDGLIQVLKSAFPEKVQDRMLVFVLAPYTNEVLVVFSMYSWFYISQELQIVYDEDLMNGPQGRRWKERIRPKSRRLW